MNPHTTAYVVVPGIDGSGPGHWQTHWERAWGSAATRIAPASWSDPDLDDWVGSVDRAVRAAGADRVVVVAHSLGCWAASEWVRRGGTHPDLLALLVAPPDHHGPRFPADHAPDFVPLVATALPFPALVVASADDPYCDLGTASRLAGSWGARLVDVGAHGHLNEATELGDWERGRALLAGLESR